MDNLKSRNYNNTTKTVVWFNSIGVNNDGTSKKVSKSFVYDLDALAISLTQQLSVMKGELWHNITFGVPILDKIKTKALIDAEVSKIVLNNSNVIDITEFTSHIINHKYECNLLINSIFGSLEVIV